jgi:hypothetical protein
VYELTPEQVAAARAYILNNADTVLARHLEIEAQIAAGNPPEVVERAKQTHAAFLRFRAWLADRQRAEGREDVHELTRETDRTGSGLMPTFRQWLEEEPQSHAGS